MGADADFDALYRELGVTANCDIGQFRQAYRRRVGSLHPDHLGTDAGVARLQQLNQAYARAAEFHRLHGRLPGAARIEGARAPFGSTPQPVPAVVDDPPAVAGKRHRTRYSVLVALIALTLLWLHLTGSFGPRVSLGMEADNVRAIQGEPSAINGPHWEYGASWIEFRCGKVVDWYSAPRQPLRVDEDPAPRDEPWPADHVFGC